MRPTIPSIAVVILFLTFCSFMTISCNDSVSSGEDTYSISGKIADGDGTGIPDVRITLNSKQMKVLYTELSGTYAFENLSPGDYTLTYEVTGYVLDHSARNCTIKDADINLGTNTATLSCGISGYVLDTAGNGVAGVEVALSKNGIVTQITDTTGAYSFPDLVAGEYTLTPTKEGMVFTPASRTIFVQRDCDPPEPFIATRTHYTISGRVIDENNEGVFGIEVIISDNTNDYSVITDETGTYSFLGENGMTYSFSFVGEAAEFIPESIDISLSGNDVSLEDVTFIDNSDAPHILPFGVTLISIPSPSEPYVMNPPDSTYFATLSSFSISETEITNAQYAQFLNDALKTGDIELTYNNSYELWYHTYIDLAAQSGEQNQCWIALDSDENRFFVEEGKEDYPVVGVNWMGAKLFADYYSLNLPTEAEWLYAASGGNNYTYGTDDGTLASSNANYNSNIGHPVDVGSYPPNPFGLYDMCGNADEWVYDWMDEYPEGTVHNPDGPTDGTNRRVAGGSWVTSATYCSIYFRGSKSPRVQSCFTGFRVVSR